MFIRSERLFLRPVWPEDQGEVLALLAHAGERGDRAAAQMRRAPDPRYPCFLVTLPGPHGAMIVGTLCLGREGGEVRLSCVIAPAHRGAGFEIEAVRASLPLACLLGHRQVVVGTDGAMPEPAGKIDLGHDCGGGWHDDMPPLLAA